MKDLISSLFTVAIVAFVICFFAKDYIPNKDKHFEVIQRYMQEQGVESFKGENFIAAAFLTLIQLDCKYITVFNNNIGSVCYLDTPGGLVKSYGFFDFVYATHEPADLDTLK